jgi:hypothetical protein
VAAAPTKLKTGLSQPAAGATVTFAAIRIPKLLRDTHLTCPLTAYQSKGRKSELKVNRFHCL